MLSFIQISLSQACITLNDWSFSGDNGDGTCNYGVSVEVDSGNGASGTATFLIDGVVVYVLPDCTCNPSIVDFTVVVACGSTIDIAVEYDAPGVGNDCTGTTGAIILPVNWYAPLEAKIIDGSTMVTFGTSQEIYSSHFLLQHSGDGINFQSIDRIEAQGISMIKHDYSYEHRNPSYGANFYRLKQFDLDGQYSYSHTVTVFNSSLNLEIFPNPVMEVLFLDSAPKGIVEVFNSQGKKMFSKNVGPERIKLDMTMLKKGVYFLHFEDGQVAKVMKN